MESPLTRPKNMDKHVGSIRNGKTFSSKPRKKMKFEARRRTNRITPPNHHKRKREMPIVKRRSRRGNSSISLLAETILSGKNVVFITGAGLSVRSGIRPFRGDDGLWAEVVWSNATREAFRRDPLQWYNNFWLKHFPPSQYNADIYQPNDGHEALAELTNLPNANIRIITQNVDGLHSKTKTTWDWKQNLIEAHGRVGLYKCIPEEDSDTDDSSDEDEDRLVKLGSRKKSRELIEKIMNEEKAIRLQECKDGKNKASPKGKKRHLLLPPRKRWCRVESKSSLSSSKNKLCRYQILDSIPVQKILPLQVKDLLKNYSCEQVKNKRNIISGPYDSDDNFPNETNTLKLNEAPRCLGCGSPCLPQALLFDEGYHSHAFYRFMDMEDWITKADALVFVGTSFAVTVTDVALSFARESCIPVYNFNVESGNGRLESTSRLNVENIMGDASVTLPNLLQICKDNLNEKCKKLVV